MSTYRMTRQAVPVRPVHFETPNSYLKRLCVANSVDLRWMETIIKQRRVTNEHDAREIGVVINELGGPEPVAFESAHARARIGYSTTRGAWDKQRSTRTACLSCTEGIRVSTYPHVRFAFCQRHGQWLGNTQRQGILDAELWKAERLCRRLVSTGQVDVELYEGAWETVRDHAFLAGEGSWTARLRRTMELPDVTVGVDDRIALFPQTVLSLKALTRQPIIEMAHRVPRKDRDVLVRLSEELSWAGSESWLLVNGLLRLLQQRSDRTA